MGLQSGADASAGSTLTWSRRCLSNAGDGSAANSACASPGTPLSVLPFEFDPIVARSHDKVAVQNFRQGVAALILQAEVLRQRNARRLVREPAGTVHTSSVPATAAPTEAPHIPENVAEGGHPTWSVHAAEERSGSDMALQAAMRQSRARQQWEEMQRVACGLWEADSEADSTPTHEAQLEVRWELDAMSKAKQETHRKLVSAQEADKRLASVQERAIAAERALLEQKVDAAEQKAAAAERKLRASEMQRDTAVAYIVEQEPLGQKIVQAETKAAEAEKMLRGSEKQRDTAIAYMVGQEPLEKKVAEAEAKTAEAEARVAEAEAKVAEADRTSKTLERQRDTAMAFLVDQNLLKTKVFEAETMLRVSEKQRDTAIAYMVGQEPLEKKVAEAEAKAEKAEKVLKTSETQRDTAISFLVDQGAIAFIADKQPQDMEAQERRTEGRRQQAREQDAAARVEEQLERQRREARQRAADAHEIATPSTQPADHRIRHIPGASSPLGGTGDGRLRRSAAVLESMEPISLNNALVLTYRQLKRL